MSVHQEGKGTAPIKVKSVANLLLFNTQENPFRRFKQLDPLEGVEFAEEPKEPEKPAPTIGDQPATFGMDEYLVRGCCRRALTLHTHRTLFPCALVA